MSAWRGRVLAAFLVGAMPAAAQPADLPPAGWAQAWNYLVESVCVDARDHAISGTSPLGGTPRCVRTRKLRVGEALPYRKRDWPGEEDRGALPWWLPAERFLSGADQFGPGGAADHRFRRRPA